MLTTTTKLRLTVGAGVLSVVLVGTVALTATQHAANLTGGVADLRVVQALLAITLVLAVVLGWFAYASLQDDLAKRTEVEAALRESEAKFSGILEIAADAVISVDEQQRILHFNRGAELIFGYTADETVGASLAMLLPERYRQGHAAHIRGFGASLENARQMANRREIFGLRKGGMEFPAEASISKLAQVGGAMVYTVNLRDVTERRQRDEAQRRLSHAVAMLGETLEVAATERSIVQLPLPWLGDGVLLDVETGGSHLRRIPARTSDPRLTAALAAVAESGLDKDSPSRVVDVLRHGEPEWVAEVTEEWLEAHTPDATSLARMRALGMRSLLLLPLVAREHVLGVLQIFRTDVARPFTEAERSAAEELAVRAAFALDNARLYETAQAATRARDHALGVVSHDLRNPISAIGMSARALLAATPPDAPERRELAENIVTSQELTQRMIRDLLDVANIEVGRLAVERHPVALAPILERAVALFRREATDRGVPIILEPVPPLPEISGDAERLVQVMANLLSNAMRYTDRGGRVTVRVRRNGEEVEVSVEDTGSGIDPAAMPLIFERYWTVKGTAPKGGTGLGLAIARGIVEGHGGRLSAESMPGEGSTFRFTLRVAS
ncbi:MAG: PAS domain-containing sensor histidine kinase [Gemmatimonadota bacterium]|nr:PAS domain-containing sensor histidine kinase [Gemmatimonadota bacterium]